jgi:heat shock protein HslJ
MKPLILLLAAAATIGAAPAHRPARHAAPYEASGFEPSWVVRISGGRLTFDPGTTQPGFTIRLPRRQPTRRGYRLVMPGLIVDVRHEPCSSYDGRDFPDTVYALFNGSNHDGCGGGSIPRWHLTGSSWSINSVGGTRLPDPPGNYNVDFDEGGRVVIQSACAKYEGTFRVRRPRLQIANLARTWTACPARAVEPRILAILRAPMRMRFTDGDNLFLTSRTGTLHLVP